MGDRRFARRKIAEDRATQLVWRGPHARENGPGEKEREEPHGCTVSDFRLNAKVVPRFPLIALACALLARVSGAEGAGPPLEKNFTLAEPPIAMVWIAPGTFLMSSPHGAGDDTVVTLTRGYWLGQTEVTQGQWQAVMDYVPVPSLFKGSERPVEQVAWSVTIRFCRSINERERRAGRLPPGYEYNLPTEAQWEYACRAGTTGLYAGNLDALGWYDANSGGETHPVAQKQPNAWGLYDMHGNVEDWCSDWYGAYPGGRVNDPIGSSVGQFHVVRGGSWNSTAGACRSAFRHWAPVESGGSAIGFRLALVPRR
jgi:formylglycine-generating enzyme required for sulfatase activity